ncbi:MAG: tRNA (guanine(46)-N(7))-methyltransferase TrmB [Myxococcota bacterium]
MSPILASEELRERGTAEVLGAPRVVLELGFGRGELLLDLAEAEPKRVFLGVEIRRARVLKVERRAEKRGLANVFLLHAPAEYALERVLSPGCVEECWINCPDPWPKKRHWRRRLIQPPLVALLARALASDALLHVSTDHPGYRDWIAGAMAVQTAFANLHAPSAWSDASPLRRETAYESEWRAEGRAIAYFDYRRSQ